MQIGNDASQSARMQIYQQQAEKVARARQEQDAAAQKSAAAQGDSVQVSDSARLMSEAHRVARETPDMRQDKVAMLKEQVQNGSYEIDSRRIAQGILREDNELFGS